MKALFALCCVALATVSLAADRMYGKTHAQALSMGQKRWYDYCADKPSGSSTMGMVQSGQFYVDAATERNKKYIDKWPEAQRKDLTDLDSSMTALGSKLLEVEYVASGMATIYQPMFVERTGDWEDLFYGILRHHKLKMDAPMMGMREVQEDWWGRMKDLAKGSSVKQEDIDKPYKESLDLETLALGQTQKFDDPIQLPCRRMVGEWFSVANMS